jgi:ribosomal protein L11 methyltransferase
VIDRPPDGTRWPTLEVELPADREDELVARLPAAVAGVERCSTVSGDRCRLVLCLDPGAHVSTVEVETLLALASIGLAPDGSAIARGRIDDGRWVERWIEGLRPLPLGRRFAVVPGSVPLPAELAGRVPVRLVPGRAFGTGEHATTRLCAAALEDAVEPGSRWVDVGCGTAVLSIVARHLGATEVLALDTDPVAVEVAREILAANGIAGVRVAAGSLDAARAGRWDGIVANVSAAFASGAVRPVARSLVPGGRAVLSGFLGSDAPDIERRAVAAGLAVTSRSAEGDWRAVVLERERG